MKTAVIFAAFAAVFSFSPAYAAQDLVNGGFENGSFAGWDQVGDTGYSVVYSQNQAVYGDTLPVDVGHYSAAFGPNKGLGGITQTIDTTPNKDYEVSFDLANTDTTANNQFFFSFDDGYQVEGDALDPFGFQTIVVPVTASGLTADVSFLFYNPSGFFLLDNISVTPVPEPASWAMLLVGFGVIGATARRRRLAFA